MLFPFVRNFIYLASLSSTVNAHWDAQTWPQLKILGGRHVLERLNARRDITERAARNLYDFDRLDLSKRYLGEKDVNKHKKCGPGVGSCEPGDCCSIGGNCGRGYHYCSGPACQLRYGTGCDGNQRPKGESTINVPRPAIGQVTYNGSGIYECKSPGDIALTFDDGPYNFTSHLLDMLASHGAKATFFITGNNMGKGQIDYNETGYPELIRRMHKDGHQIASHSWTHQNMSELNATEMENQIHYNEMAFRNVLGFFPTYYRPPYSECRDDCQALMKKLGYHVTYYSLITSDYLYNDPSLIHTAKEKFVDRMQMVTPGNVKYITIAHDIHYQTVYNLTQYMLDYFSLFNFSRSVTVGECLGDPKENWYRTAGGAPDAKLLLTSGATIHVEIWSFSMALWMLIGGITIVANL